MKHVAWVFSGFPSTVKIWDRHSGGDRCVLREHAGRVKNLRVWVGGANKKFQLAQDFM